MDFPQVKRLLFESIAAEWLLVSSEPADIAVIKILSPLLESTNALMRRK
jgi:hypothetical protein